MLPDNYIRPHRHADYVTNECLLAMCGRFLLIELDDPDRLVQPCEWAS